MRPSLQVCVCHFMQIHILVERAHVILSTSMYIQIHILDMKHRKTSVLFILLGIFSYAYLHIPCAVFEVVLLYSTKAKWYPVLGRSSIIFSLLAP